MTNPLLACTLPEGDEDTRPEPTSGITRVSTCPSVVRLGERAPGSSWIVRRPLGKGGVGEVYEVEHALLGRRAALKILSAEHLQRPGLAERMALEGRLLASVRHDNLVDVLDLGLLDQDARPYLVLELLSGRDLRAELRRVGVFSVPSALALVSQALAGLAALHRAGIVHCDVKLENLFLCTSGRLKILDLGAAESMDLRPATPSPVLCTPRTMAPEQGEGKTLDGRVDLYALGLVLYELVAGCGPFDDVEDLSALRFAHVARLPEPPSSRAPQPIPQALDALVLRALAKSPDDRFASADAMAAEVSLLLASLQTKSRPAARPSLALEAPTLAATLSSFFRDAPPAASRFPADVSCRVVVSALAISALALGLTVGRLLPSAVVPSLGAAVVAR